MKQGNQGPVVPGPQVKKEQRMDFEKLAEMPLESLLYYVLVGDGRKRSKPAEG